MYQLINDDDNAVLRLDDGARIPKGHRWWDDYQSWLAEGNVPEPDPGGDLASLRQAQLDQINAAYEAEFADVKRLYPESERLSWPVQLREALEWEANQQTETPFLDILLVDRGFGETKSELVEKVKAKSEAYMCLSATLSAKRHRLERAIESADSAEAVEALAW